MKSLTDSEGVRLLSISARISSEEFSTLLDSEGPDRAAYFEVLEKKYGKRNLEQKKETP